MYKTKDDYIQEWMRQFDFFFYKKRLGIDKAGIKFIYLHGQYLDMGTFLYYKNEKYQKVWHYFNNERQ